MTENEREAPATTEWQQIGEIGVDSAQIILVDPVHADDLVGYVMGSPLVFESIEHEFGVPAVVVSSGLGDGVYPVEARFEEAEGTVRVAEVRIRFLPHPVIGYELPL